MLINTDFITIQTVYTFLGHLILRLHHLKKMFQYSNFLYNLPGPDLSHTCDSVISNLFLTYRSSQVSYSFSMSILSVHIGGLDLEGCVFNLCMLDKLYTDAGVSSEFLMAKIASFYHGNQRHEKCKLHEWII